MEILIKLGIIPDEDYKVLLQGNNNFQSNHQNEERMER